MMVMFMTMTITRVDFDYVLLVGNIIIIFIITTTNIIMFLPSESETAMELLGVGRAMEHLLDSFFHLYKVIITMMMITIVIITIVIITIMMITKLFLRLPSISRRSRRRRQDQEASSPDYLFGGGFIKLSEKDYVRPLLPTPLS